MSTHSKGKASEMKHYAGKAVFSAAVGHALDGLDLMILSFALSGIMATIPLQACLPPSHWLAPSLVV